MPFKKGGATLDVKKNPMDTEVAQPDLGVPALSVNPTPPPQPQPADGEENRSDGEH